MVGQIWPVGCNFLKTDINNQEIAEDLESVSLESLASEQKNHRQI